LPWSHPISCSRADRPAQASATNTTLLAKTDPGLRTAEERGQSEKRSGSREMSRRGSAVNSPLRP